MAENLTSYQRWAGRLTELLDFTRTGPGDADWSWKCGSPETGDRLALSRQAAADLGLSWDAMMAEARKSSHVCCDCEIVFNKPEE